MNNERILELFRKAAAETNDIGIIRGYADFKKKFKELLDQEPSDIEKSVEDKA